MNPNGLPWTGDRLVPSFTGDIVLEHLHRYFFPMELAVGKDVLDIACGEGYVGNLLAIRARSVTGVDISLEAIKTVSPSVALTDGFTYFGCRILA